MRKPGIIASTTSSRQESTPEAASAARLPKRVETVPAIGMPKKEPMPRPKSSVPSTAGSSESSVCTKGMMGAQLATVKPPVKKPARAAKSLRRIFASCCGVLSGAFFELL